IFIILKYRWCICLILSKNIISILHNEHSTLNTADKMKKNQQHPILSHADLFSQFSHCQGFCKADDYNNIVFANSTALVGRQAMDMSSDNWERCFVPGSHLAGR